MGHEVLNGMNNGLQGTERYGMVWKYSRVYSPNPEPLMFPCPAFNAIILLDSSTMRIFSLLSRNSFGRHYDSHSFCHNVKQLYTNKLSISQKKEPITNPKREKERILSKHSGLKRLPKNHFITYRVSIDKVRILKRMALGIPHYFIRRI